MNVLVFQIISEGKGDALHLKEVYEVYIVSLVEEKAVNYNVDEPQNQRVERKKLRDVQQAWRWLFMYILLFYSVFLDF